MTAHLRGLLEARFSPLHVLRNTIRLRLTVLYGALFLASGIGLLAMTYLLVRRATNNFFCSGASDRRLCLGSITGASNGGNIHVLSRHGTSGHIPTPQHVQLQAHQLLAQAAQQHAAELHQLLVQSGIALGIMAVVSVALGWFLAGRVLRPLHTITTTVRDISTSNLHERVALAGPDDELKELGDTFDSLLARLEASFEAQRQFVANASHELRTPLARQRTLLEVALSDPQVTVDSLRATSEQVLAAGEQQERLIEALLTLARSERGLERWESFDLAALARDVLRVRRQEAEQRGLRVGTALEPALTSGDPRLVERLVANLVDNAMRYNVVQGRVCVATRIKAGHAVLSIVNSGPVIPAADVDRLLQPFQRLGRQRANRGDGLGLGLSIAQAIAGAHHGAVCARSLAEGGLDIQVSFPAAAIRSGDRLHPAFLLHQHTRGHSLTCQTEDIEGCRHRTALQNEDGR